MSTSNSGGKESDFASPAGLPDAATMAQWANEFFRAVPQTDAVQAVTTDRPPTLESIPEDQLSAVPSSIAREIPSSDSSRTSSTEQYFSFLREARGLIPAVPAEAVPR